MRQQGCELLHILAADSLAIAIEQRGYIIVKMCGGIGKIDHPTVANIGTHKILALRTHLCVVEKRYMPAGDLIKQAEVVVEFARRMSPITGPFLAGSVGFGIVQELIHTAHALPYASIHEAVVVLGEHHHLQHIAVAPRIPIIDDFIGFSVQRKPPFVLPFQVRNSDAVVQFLVQALGNNGIDLVHLCVQEIVRPCQKSAYLSAAEVDDLVGVIGEVAPIVLAVQVGGKHP